MELSTYPDAKSRSPSIGEGGDSGRSADPIAGDSAATAGQRAGAAAEASIPPLSASWRETPLSDYEQGKIQLILESCRDRDLSRLQDLATSEGGLVEDEVRRTAWPILLGSDRDHQDTDVDYHSLPKQRDEDQVKLDVERSFVHYPEHESETRKDARKQELSNVITAVLRCHPQLHYFQGYHDIVQVVLLVLGARAAVPAVARLSLLRIRDFMLPTMSSTELHLQLVPVVLYAVDPPLYEHLSQTRPFFALPAALTLYAHEIEVYGDIARLFDFLLAHEAAVSLYLFAVIVMSRKDELLEVEADETDMLHAILSKLPKPLDLDALIERTMQVFKQYPPNKLPGRAWARISTNSVLKTTEDSQQLYRQTLQDGERFYAKHAREVKRGEDWERARQRTRLFVRRNKRPAMYLGGALLVAIFAYRLRNNGLSSGLTGFELLVLELQQRASALMRHLWT